jgi:2-desacetyl-2-hydroxyethyl bacteriochlorophyllide A dehydrogenase
MKAVVIPSPSVVEVQELGALAPGSDDVLIAVALVGICATDLHILDGHFPTARYPITPGHEVTGTVVEIGDGVTTLAVGDRIVIDPGVPCGSCRLCRDGRPNLCENRNAFGITFAGGAAEFLTLPATSCHLVLPGTPPEVAVLAEPLACVTHAFDLVRDPAGEDVLIYGAGTIGLLATFVAVHLGAASVSVVELDERRREKSLRAGAVASAASADEFAPRADWGLVIDATGAPAAISDGIDRVRRGGTFLQIGVAHPERSIDLKPYDVFSRELSIVGSMTTRYSFPRALSLLASGAVDASLITGEAFPLSRYAEAAEAARQGETLKVTVSPGS